jgi:hypothetical protein
MRRERPERARFRHAEGRRLTAGPPAKQADGGPHVVTSDHTAPITEVTTAQSDQLENLPGRIALEASDYLAPGLALLAATFVVVLGARVDAQAGLHDPVQGRVSLAVAAAVETTVLPTARGTLNWADTAQRRERRLTAQAFRVVPPP